MGFQLILGGVYSENYTYFTSIQKQNRCTTPGGLAPEAGVVG